MATVTNTDDGIARDVRVYVNAHGDRFTDGDGVAALLSDWEERGDARRPRGYDLHDNGDFVVAYFDGDEMTISFLIYIDEKDAMIPGKIPDRVYSLGGLPFEFTVEG
jgi:hypothetical protein